MRASLDMSAPLKFVPYDATVADLAGGEPRATIAEGQVVDGLTGERRAGAGEGRVPSSVARLLQEAEEKMQELRLQGRMRGTVIIEDVDSDVAVEEIK